MKIVKVILVYVAFLASVSYAFDAYPATGSAAPTSDACGPLGTSDVTFVYGSQVPGEAPQVRQGVTPPTLIVFTTPIIISGHVPHMARTHRRGALNHANVIARSTSMHRVSASYTSGDLPGAPQDVSGLGCETVGPRLDGTSVTICGGTVTSVIGPDGTVHADPFSRALF